MKITDICKKLINKNGRISNKKTNLLEVIFEKLLSTEVRFIITYDEKYKIATKTQPSVTKIGILYSATAKFTADYPPQTLAYELTKLLKNNFSHVLRYGAGFTFNWGPIVLFLENRYQLCDKSTIRW